MMKNHPKKKKELVYPKKEAVVDAKHANMANGALVSFACLRNSA